MCLPTAIITIVVHSDTNHTYKDRRRLNCTKLCWSRLVYCFLSVCILVLQNYWQSASDQTCCQICYFQLMARLLHIRLKVMSAHVNKNLRHCLWQIGAFETFDLRSELYYVNNHSIVLFFKVQHITLLVDNCLFMLNTLHITHFWFFSFHILINMKYWL